MSLDTATITIDDSDEWTLLQAEIVEAVSASGYINAEVLSASDDITPESMLGKNVLIKIPTTDSTKPWRQVKGMVWEWQSMGPFRKNDKRSIHRLIVLPPICLLSLRRFHRAFNDLPATQVWKQLLNEWGERVPFSDEGPMMSLENEPCAVPLITAQQSNQTDLEFLTDLFQSHGVFWYNDSDGEASQPMLTLGTLSSAAKPWATNETLSFNPQLTPIAYGPNVIQWTQQAFNGPRVPVVHGMNPSFSREVQPQNINAILQNPSNTNFRGFDWFYRQNLAPKSGLELSDMQSRTSRVFEQTLALDNLWGTGMATTTTLAPGRKVTIDNLPGNSPSDWFVVSTRNLISGPGIGEGTLADETQLLTSLRAVPLQTPFRPPLNSDRLEPPEINGSNLDPDLRVVMNVGESHG